MGEPWCYNIPVNQKHGYIIICKRMIQQGIFFKYTIHTFIQFVFMGEIVIEIMSFYDVCSTVS